MYIYSERIQDIAAFPLGTSTCTHHGCSMQVSKNTQPGEYITESIQTFFLIISWNYHRYIRLHTSSKRLADLPPSDRPTIGASSIFENLEADKSITEQVTEQAIPHEEREVCFMNELIFISMCILQSLKSLSYSIIFSMFFCSIDGHLPISKLALKSLTKLHDSFEISRSKMP